MKLNLRYIKSKITWFVAVAILCTCMPAHAQTSADLKAWGEECLLQIEKDYSLPGWLYADEWKRDYTGQRQPAFMWGCGVMLPALVVGARVDQKQFLSQMQDYIAALDGYWSPGNNGIPGYDVVPSPRSPDRYYDDNMWVDIALLDAYDLTKDNTYLDKAKSVFTFIKSGEDDKLGGGIYWRERDKASKNTCSNGPAVVAALRLYQTTREQSYLADAKRIYAWTNAHLQDTDGLYWDNIKLSGAVEKTKWSYNTALMLRANVLLYATTHDNQYRVEAERIAKAAETHWIKPDTGAIADGGQFAHLLCEAFLALNKEDHDDHWSAIVLKALAYVHNNLRDTEGRYGSQWDKPILAPIDKAGILSQASVARAFLFAASLKLKIK